MTSQAVARRPGNVTIEDARLVYKNFAGREGEYNEAGVRSFACVLPEDIAQAMAADGWNVKRFKPRMDDDPNTVPEAYVPVAVSYRIKPPRVVMVAERYNHRTGEFEKVRTNIPEELVEMLDYADMAKVDLIINPSFWSKNGRSGIKAYLHAIYVTVRMDALERKYAEVPEVEFGSGEMLQIEAGPEQDDEYDMITLGEEDYTIEEED